MTKLQTNFGVFYPIKKEFQDYTKTLTNEGKAIHSLRGFACATSMLIPSYHLWFAAAEVSMNEKRIGDYSERVIRTYMVDAMLDHLLIQIRRIYDPTLNSLAAGTIVKSLDNPTIRNHLITRASVSAKEKGEVWVNNHLNLVHEYCSLGLITKKSDLPIITPLFQIQVFLARRAANKRAAHMTLDDFGISPDDIYNLCYTTIIIARSIHRVLREDAYVGSYADVDEGAYEAASRFFRYKHTAGLLTSNIEDDVDEHVSCIGKQQEEY